MFPSEENTLGEKKGRKEWQVLTWPLKSGQLTMSDITSYIISYWRRLKQVKSFSFYKFYMSKFYK